MTHSSGNFKVVGGWLGGLLTNPKMEMTPALGVSNDPSKPEFKPWSFAMKATSGVVSLTDEKGTLVPEGFLD